MSEDLASHLATAIDVWHETHPDLTLGEITDALEELYADIVRIGTFKFHALTVVPPCA